MKLYITSTSPYARIARIVAIEKGLGDIIEIVPAKTRTPNSPYYAVNASGRVPYLVLDDGRGIEDSQLIASYLDQSDGRPKLTPPWSTADWAYGELEARARSIADGMSVWVREMRRPEMERSPTVLAHEMDRAGRLADWFEGQISSRLMQGDLNLAQLYLLAGLDQANYWKMGDFTKGRPKLAIWLHRLHERPSVKATIPG
ncbi:MAG: glutathione S-transferase N-terminal domain-containing protein [Proteobacteria bacterium]|nr:glutathione S-transferase N-terminal domain-containing protein [Pseudomonadota bacterium]